MLLAILNTCSQEELLEDEAIFSNLANQTGAIAVAGSPTSPNGTSPAMAAHDAEMTSLDEKEANRKRIRQKILAIGRISRVFSVLRTESESISELKDLMGTTRLPYGSLALGAEGLKKAIHSFEDAKRSDQDNERLPPTKEEKVKEEHEKILKAIDEASHTPQSELDELTALKMAEVVNTSASS
jgi:serine/threonine-protein phosphatase 2B catalytic subunit